MKKLALLLSAVFIPLLFQGCDKTSADAGKNYDWDWLMGEWNAIDLSLTDFQDVGGSYKLDIVKKDENTCVFKGGWSSTMQISAKVYFEDGLLIIPGNQFMYKSDSETTCYFIATNPLNGGKPYEDLSTPVIARLTSNSIVVDNWTVLYSGGASDGKTFHSDHLRTIFTR